MSTVFQNSFTVTPYIWNYSTAFAIKVGDLKVWFSVSVFLPVAFSCTCYGSALKARSMKLALSFSRKCPETWSEGGEKKVGFLAWLPNLFLSSIILRVRQLLSARSTCIILHACRITLCWVCSKFFVCSEATHTVPVQPIVYIHLQTIRELFQTEKLVPYRGTVG